MGLLRWFNKKRYSGIGEALTDIRKELQALQPTDSEDVVWSRQASGMSASLRTTNITESTGNTAVDDVSDTKKYQFKIVREGDTKVKVVNGFAPENSYAGNINGVHYPVAEFAVTSTPEYIYAINGEIKKFSKQINSNVFPCVLLGKVFVKDKNIHIEQLTLITDSSHTVPVVATDSSAVSVKWEISSDGIISATAAVTMTFNGAGKSENITLTADDKGRRIVFAVKKLIGDGTTAVESEIQDVASDDKTFESYAHSENLMVYVLKSDTTSSTFNISYVAPTAWRYSYAYISPLFCKSNNITEGAS